MPPVTGAPRCGRRYSCASASADPSLVASTATIERLDPAALDAAVAHELAHAAHRDPRWGYLLIAVRAVAFFNPAVQWIARAVVDDIERRADADGPAPHGRPEALARAIRILMIGEATPAAGRRPSAFERIFWASRVLSVERRCARLLAGPPPAHLEAGPLRLVLAAGGIIGLVFFVV